MDCSEAERLRKLCIYEQRLFKSGCNYIAGLDEVGRGSIAGPLVAVAVILDKDNLIIEKVNDSKKINAVKRKELYKSIAHSCKCWSVAEVTPQEIDDINISNANILAFKRAILSLKIKPDAILSDFLKVDLDIKNIPLTKGDSLSISIAAASIIAKVTRDNIMIKQSELYPEYGFSHNKGYATKKHLTALQKYGPCSIHRLSFAGVLA